MTATSAATRRRLPARWIERTGLRDGDLALDVGCGRAP
jgi:hypothetical protein